MGYGTRNNGFNGQIETFWPDDDENTIYLQAHYFGIDLSDILETINDKWPNTSFDDIEIEAEYIHTDCLYYDLYDSSDYTNFIKITKKGK